MRSFITLVLALGLLATLSFANAAGAASGEPSIRTASTFTVDDAPAGPWEVYVSVSRLGSKWWPGPHTHPGPEFGIVLDGQLRRWNIGRGFATFETGEGFHTSGGVVHEGGNSSDFDAVGMNTHILTAGGQFNIPANPAPPDAPKATGQQTVFFRVKFPMATHPANPFKMTMEVLDFPAGLTVPPHTAGGTALFVVFDGRLSVTANGGTKTYGPNDSFVVSPGTLHSIAVLDGKPAVAVVTLMR